jgi:hypothetical protein
MRKKAEEAVATNMAAIKIDYDRTLLMSVEDGLELMKLIATAELMKGYDESNLEFKPYDETIMFKLMSVQEYKEKKFAKVLDTENENED